MTLPAGTKLGPFEIRSLLGAGGMGEVYRALDTRLDRTVAIKILSTHLSENSAAQQRFDREARAISSLNHPNICTLHDIGSQGGIDYLVMEYLEGETLADRLLKGPLPTDLVLRYAIEICEGLERAHKSGIVHRDLKPGNVMLTKTGAKLMDFGLAKAMNSPAPLSAGPTVTMSTPLGSHPLTAQGTLVGTFQYMSPEQLEGREADARSDIFALGAVLYEMITGERAFKGNTTASVIAGILSSEPQSISAVQPMAPPPLDRAVKACLAKDPDERIQAVHDLKLQLRWIGEGAWQAGATAPVAVGKGTRERLAWALVGVATAISAFLAASQAGRAPIELPLRKFEKTVDNLRVGYRNHPVISPDANKIAYISGNQLFVWYLDQVGPRELYRDKSGTVPVAVFWSPDSQTIAFANDLKLWRVPIGGGPAAEICSLPSGLVSGAWGADDSIVVAGWRNDMYRVSARGGDAKPLALLKPGHEVDFHALSFLPGGRDLLYEVHSLANGIIIEVLSGGKRKKIFERKDWKLGGTFYSPTGHLVFDRDDGAAGMWAVPFSLAKLETTGEPFLIATGAELPTISNDATLLYAMAAPAELGQLVLVSRDGKVATPLAQPQPNLSAPALSWDGKRVAFVSGATEGNIWIYDLDRRTQTKLPGDGALMPAWLPGDNRILFVKQGSALTDTDNTLYVRAADGSGDAQELLTGFWPKISAGGNYLTYTLQEKNGRWNVWYLPLQNGTIPSPHLKPTLFTNTSPDERLLAISPDEHYAAYQSTESGRSEIFIKRFPSGEGKLQVSVNGGVTPTWSKRGDELFYREGSSRMMVVPISTQPKLTVGPPRNLFAREDWLAPSPQVGGFGSGYDVTLDGKRFLIIQRVGDQTPRRTMVIVQNWFAEFKNKEKK